MPNLAERVIFWLTQHWFDPMADAAKTARTDAAVARSQTAIGRADRAVQAYRAEGRALRRGR